MVTETEIDSETGIPREKDIYETIHIQSREYELCLSLLQQNNEHSGFIYEK
jgi:hypothetical protein